MEFTGSSWSRAVCLLKTHAKITTARRKTMARDVWGRLTKNLLFAGANFLGLIAVSKP